MEIHHFPQVQILGNHAKIREGRQYIDLGFYNSDGTFEWSPEGAARRDALLAPEVVESIGETSEATQEYYDSLPDTYAVPAEKTEDPLDAKLAESRERNAASYKKQNRRAR